LDGLSNEEFRRKYAKFIKELDWDKINENETDSISTKSGKRYRRGKFIDYDDDETTEESSLTEEESQPQKKKRIIDDNE
jgi:hypothetical protein